MDMDESLADPQQTASTLLFCRMCQAVYTQPKLLPCLHSFCTYCLESAATHGVNGACIICPLCSHEARLPNSGVAGIPDNSFLNRLCQEYLAEVQTHLVARSLYPTSYAGASNVISPTRRRSISEASQKYASSTNPRSEYMHQEGSQADEGASLTSYSDAEPNPIQTTADAAVEAIRNMSKLQTKIMSLQGEALRVTYAIDLVNQYASDWQQHKEDFKLSVQRRATQFQFFIQRMEHQVKTQIDSKTMDDMFYAESSKGKVELRQNLNNILHEVNVLKGIQELGKDAEINALSSTVLGKSVGLNDVLFKKMHFELDTPTKTIEEIVSAYFGDIRFDCVETNVYAPKIMDFNEVPVGTVPETSAVDNYFRFDERRQAEIDNRARENAATASAKGRSVDRRSRRYNTDLGLNNQDVKEYLAQFQDARETFRARRREILAQGQRAREDSSPLRDGIPRRPRSTSRKGRVQSLDRVALPVPKREITLANRASEAPEIRTARSPQNEAVTNSDEEENPYSLPHDSISTLRGVSTSRSIPSIIPEDLGIPSPIPEDALSPVSPQRKLVKQTSDPRYFRDKQPSPEGQPSPDILTASQPQSLIEQLRHRRRSNPGFSTTGRNSDQLASFPSGEYEPLGVLMEDRVTGRPVRRAISGAADRKSKIEFLRENWQKRKDILIQSEGFVSSEVTKKATRTLEPLQPVLKEDTHSKSVTPVSIEVRSPPSMDLSDNPQHETMDQIRSRIAQYRQEISQREESQQKLVTISPIKYDHSVLSAYTDKTMSERLLDNPEAQNTYRASNIEEKMHTTAVDERKHESNNSAAADEPYNKDNTEAIDENKLETKAAVVWLHGATDAAEMVDRTTTNVPENVYANTPADRVFGKSNTEKVYGANNPRSLYGPTERVYGTTEKVYGTTVGETANATTSDITIRANETTSNTAEQNYGRTTADNEKLNGRTTADNEKLYGRTTADNETLYGRTTADNSRVQETSDVSDIGAPDTLSRTDVSDKTHACIDEAGRRTAGTNGTTDPYTLSETGSGVTMTRTNDVGAPLSSSADATIYRPRAYERWSHPTAVEKVSKTTAIETAHDVDAVSKSPSVEILPKSTSLDTVSKLSTLERAYKSTTLETVSKPTTLDTELQLTQIEHVSLPATAQFMTSHLTFHTVSESPTSFQYPTITTSPTNIQQEPVTTSTTQIASPTKIQHEPAATSTTQTTAPTNVQHEPAATSTTPTTSLPTPTITAPRSRYSRFPAPKTETLDIASLIAAMYSGNEKTILQTSKPSTDVSSQPSKPSTGVSSKPSKPSTDVESQANKLSTDAFSQPGKPSTDAFSQPRKPSSDVSSQPSKPSTDVSSQPSKPSTEVSSQPSKPSTDVSSQSSKPSTDVSSQPSKPSTDVSSQPSIAASATTTTTSNSNNTLESSIPAEIKRVKESNAVEENRQPTESSSPVYISRFAESYITTDISRYTESSRFSKSSKVTESVSTPASKSDTTDDSVIERDSDGETVTITEIISLDTTKGIPDKEGYLREETNNDIYSFKNANNNTTRIKRADENNEDADNSSKTYFDTYTYRKDGANHLPSPQTTRAKENAQYSEHLRDTEASGAAENLTSKKSPSSPNKVLTTPNVFTRNSFRRNIGTPQEAVQTDNSNTSQDEGKTAQKASSSEVSSNETPQKSQPRHQRQYLRSRFNDGSNRRHTIEIGKGDVMSAMQMIAEREKVPTQLQPISESESLTALNIPTEHPFHSRISTFSSALSKPEIQIELESMDPIENETLSSSVEHSDAGTLDLTIPAFKTRTPKLIPPPLQATQERALGEQPSSPQPNTSPLKSPRTPPSPLSLPQNVIDQKLKIREIARKKKERWRHLTIH